MVTGLVDATPKTKLAFSIGRVSEQQLEQVPSASVESALRGKVVGVKVVLGSGEPGTSASLQLRAPTSINASGRSQDPLYIIDGVIIDPSISGSPLSDISSVDIVSIEVVKGAAGASLYGSRAANGVVNIKTNRGKGLALNQTRIRIRNEFGFNGLQRKIGLSKSHYFRIHEGADITDANEIKVTAGDFIDPRQPGQRVPHRYTNSYETPDQGSAIFFSDKPYKWIGTGDIVLDANGVPVMDASTGQPAGMQLLPGGQTFNHMDRFFDAGNFITNSVSISRNMRDTNFSLTFGSYIQDGVIQGLNGFDRKNVRLSLDHKFRETLSISLSGYISSTDRDDIAGGPGSPFFGLTFMGGDADLAARHNTTEATVEFPDGVPQDAQGQLFIQPDGNADRSNPLYALEANQRQNKRDRVMGSISLNYAPANWAKFEGSLSYDKSSRDFSRFWPVGYQSISASVLNDGRLNKLPFI